MSIAQPVASAPPSLADLSAREKVVFAKIAWRILPLLSLAYIINFIDRNNVGFAGLTMIKDVGLTPAQFGFGVGILSAGYCLFEVPSNIALYKFGARRWLARIMISWGLISMATLFTVGPYSFYGLRFLLGAAEAGFFPGAAFYLTLWFPAEYRARIYAWFLISIPASTFVAGPVSSLLLELDQWLGIAGWQWLFLFEGLPCDRRLAPWLFHRPGEFGLADHDAGVAEQRPVHRMVVVRMGEQYIRDIGRAHAALRKPLDQQLAHAEIAGVDHGRAAVPAQQRDGAPAKPAMAHGLAGKALDQDVDAVAADVHVRDPAKS